jgi:hypothetical protein
MLVQVCSRPVACPHSQQKHWPQGQPTCERGGPPQRSAAPRPAPQEHALTWHDAGGTGSAGATVLVARRRRRVRRRRGVSGGAQRLFQPRRPCAAPALHSAPVRGTGAAQAAGARTRLQPPFFSTGLAHLGQGFVLAVSQWEVSLSSWHFCRHSFSLRAPAAPHRA